MVLTERQNDSLSEVINIAFSRAASSLSELTSRRILIEAPSVESVPIAKLPDTLRNFVDGDIATVHQIFSGAVGGDVFLLFSHESAVTLANLMTDSYGVTGKLDASLKEVLTEVGNILLNACLGTFGNLLEVRVSFAVPRLHLDTLGTLVDSIEVDQKELTYAIVASASFQVKETTVQGYLIIVLGVTSLEHLLQKLERLG